MEVRGCDCEFEDYGSGYFGVVLKIACVKDRSLLCFDPIKSRKAFKTCLECSANISVFDSISFDQMHQNSWKLQEFKMYCVWFQMDSSALQRSIEFVFLSILPSLLRFCESTVERSRILAVNVSESVALRDLIGGG